MPADIAGEEDGPEPRPIDINLATKQELVDLPGVGERLAERIISARPFEDFEAVAKLSGLSERLVARLKEAGVVVSPARQVRKTTVTLRLDVDAPGILDDSQELVTHVFDGDGDLVATAPLGARTVALPERLEDEVVAVAVVPVLKDRQPPTYTRLLASDLVVERALIVDGVLDVGRLIHIDPRWFKLSCCRVRGRVARRVDLGGGRIVERPLCHARVVICEVDKKPADIVAKLPDELVVRLWDDLVLREPIHLPEPIPTPDPGPYFLEAGGQGRLAQTANQIRNPTMGPARQFDRTRSGALHPGIADAGRVRDALLANINVVQRYWCQLGWLDTQYRVDCIATVEVDDQGNFDTDITYPCYGDKPDLYFKVEQRCRTGAWETVHAPSVHCTTRWDYCCGDLVAINVSSNKAGLGTLTRPVVFTGAPSDPAIGGRWDLLPYDSQVFAVHAALLRDGKVLMFSGGVESANYPLESRVWDPLTGAFSSQTFSEDLFCAFQNVLADGRVLVMGGTFYDGGSHGLEATFTFDPITKSWSQHPDMKWGRWYPTSVTMPDETVLVFSGRTQKGVPGDAQEVERFDPSTNSWSTLGASANKDLRIYPSMHLMSNGQVFYTGTRWAGGSSHPSWAPPPTASFDAASETWSDVGNHVIGNRSEGTSVLLPPLRSSGHGHDEPGEESPPPSTLSRVLVLGGAGSAPAERASAEIIDLADTNPAWHRIADMHHRRVNPNAVILPDGQILVCAGIAGHKWDGNPGYAYESELFDPDTLTWHRAAIMQIGRQYHSVSILLPDGRVLNAGSVGAGDRKEMEIYSPPYLFRGPRPKVTASPTHVSYGGELRLTSPDACRIRSIVLLRPGAPTHHTDTDQRYVPLHFEADGPCELTAMVPDDRNVVPPAWYLLFVLDDSGVPSIGRFVNVR